MLPPLALDILCALEAHRVLAADTLAALLDAEPECLARTCDELVRHEAIRVLGVNGREYFAAHDLALDDPPRQPHARRDTYHTSPALRLPPRTAGGPDSASGGAGG